MLLFKQNTNAKTNSYLNQKSKKKLTLRRCSTKTNKKNKLSKNPKTLKLFKQNSKITRSLLLGIILGGGFLQRLSIKDNAKIRFHFSQTNRDFALFLHNHLSTQGYCNPKSNPIKFNTYTQPSFNELHDLFYRPATESDRLFGRSNALFIKTIPKNIADFLDAPTLAFWFSFKGIINAQGAFITLPSCPPAFTIDEKNFIVNALKKNHQLTCLVYKDKIQIPNTDLQRFLSIIKPYLIPASLIKIGEIYPQSLVNKSDTLHLFYGPICLSKTEVIEQLTNTLSIKDYSIVEYPFSMEKSAYEVFLSLEKTFYYRDLNFLNVTDNNNETRTPVLKATTAFKSATALLFLEQKNVFNTFPKETLYNDLIERIFKFKNNDVLFFKLFFEQLPQAIKPEELHAFLKQLPIEYQQQKKSIFTGFFS